MSSSLAPRHIQRNATNTAADSVSTPPLSAEPALSDAERDVINDSYGSWTNFMQSFSLKPWDEEDIKEAHAILQSLVTEETDQS